MKDQSPEQFREWLDGIRPKKPEEILLAQLLGTLASRMPDDDKLKVMRLSLADYELLQIVEEEE